MSIDKHVVFVMSEETWDNFKQEEYEFANTQPDPIVYLQSLSQLNIVMDNTLPYGIVEMWDKDKYDDMENEDE